MRLTRHVILAVCMKEQLCGCLVLYKNVGSSPHSGTFVIEAKLSQYSIEEEIRIIYCQVVNQLAEMYATDGIIAETDCEIAYFVTSSTM